MEKPTQSRTKALLADAIDLQQAQGRTQDFRRVLFLGGNNTSLVRFRYCSLRVLSEI